MLAPILLDKFLHLVVRGFAANAAFFRLAVMDAACLLGKILAHIFSVLADVAVDFRDHLADRRFRQDVDGTPVVWLAGSLHDT